MAQRFGGKFSPEGENTSSQSGSGPGSKPGTPPRPALKMERATGSARRNLLYAAPLPLLWTAFRQDAAGMALDLVAAAVLVFAVYTLSEGIKAEAAYDSRKVARRPALPRKTIAAALTGLGVVLAAYAPATGQIVAPLIYGAIALILHIVAFGIDPLADKGMEGIDTFQQDRVAKAVKEAESYLEAMTEAIKRAGDRSLERRVELFQGTARTMFRTVEEDPRDLTSARKFMSVYLMGARDATIKFADLYSRTHDDKAKADYTSLLDDLETNFAARTNMLLDGDRTDLDIEIDVLRDRLGREGVRTK